MHERTSPRCKHNSVATVEFDPWDDVIGQSSAVEFLRRAAADPVHAYLLVGPAGGGKRAAARAFAADVLADGAEDPDRVRRLAGAEAHICIFQTAMGAVQAGYRPWIVADAVSSRDKRNAELALNRMQALGMAVGPTEMAVYELIHKAGSPAFKAMLPHLK